MPGERGIPFFLTEADVRATARREGCSEEDAGRQVRYAAYADAARRLGGARIAVAHNSNDNAETMLFHLFRGSGLQGLSGIAPVRGDIIRPILCLERGEVEAYLESVSMPWRRDVTNDGDDYRRNRIRHHILPYAEEAVAGGAVAHMGRTAAFLREIQGYLEEQAQAAQEKCVETEDGEGESVPWDRRFRIDAADFRELHPAIRKMLLLRLLKALSPTGKDISAVHVEDTLELFEREGNRSVCLPFGITARRQYGSVILELRQDEEKERAAGLYPIRIPPFPEIARAPFVYSLGDWGKIECRGFFIKKGQEVPLKRYTKWFDCDKIKECVEIRFRRQGDYLTIADKAGNTVHKSLKDYMINEKIPRQLRGEIPVAAAGSHVLWLAGLRISEAFKVDENTERILQVRLLGKKFCESSETEEKNGGEH